MAVQRENLAESWEGRLSLIWWLILVLLAGIVVKLFQHQVINHSYYAALARSQHLTAETLPARRGEILVYDQELRENYPLATNVTLFSLYVVPKQIRYPELTVAKLQPFLPDWEEGALLEIFKSGKLYIPPLRRKMDETEAQKIRDLELPGVYITTESYRYYPEGTLAAHVLGFVNRDRFGQYGVEAFLEKELHGVDGFLRAEKDVAGQQIALGERRSLAPRDGLSVVLTLNRAIQYYAEKALKEAVVKFEAKQGSILVMDPRTGAIWAAAAYPTFDPNLYNTTPIELFTNPNVSAAYEPGSVFKVITMAGAIDAGLVSPYTTYVDSGSVQVLDRTIKNSEEKVYGEVNMTKVLEQSINTGAIFAVQKLGKQLFYKYLKDFGFTEKTGVELSGEVAGQVKTPREWSDVDLATMSYGQGIAVTPIQLLAATGAIANGGRLLQPHIISEILYPSGPVKIEPREIRQVISPQTAQILSAMMVNVVENGHGQRAAVPGYLIAGKTGTAQVPIPGGYSKTRTIGTFVGFGPVEAPRFVILTRIDEPKTVQFAESSAAPLFGQIAKFILDYLQIPPTR